MKKPGQVALVPFPRVDLTPGNPRLVLLLARVPGPYDDWLVWGLQDFAGFRSKGIAKSPHFPVQTPRLGANFVPQSRDLAIPRERKPVEDLRRYVLGSIGAIGEERLRRIREKLAD